MSILSNLKPPAGSRHKKKRIGRGPGSGNGKTAGKGMNGQNSRSGSGGRLYFEGGQMPLARRLPKRGFFNVHAAKVVNINVGALDALESGAEVDIDLLRSLRILKGQFDRLKILGNGELSKKLTVTAHSFSAGAKAKIEKAGGTAVEIPRPVRSTDTKAEA